MKNEILKIIMLSCIKKKKAIYFKNMVTLFILVLEQLCYILTIRCQRKVKTVLRKVY